MAKKKVEQQIIECPDCESKVSANVIAKKEYGPTEYNDPYCIYFLECPACNRTMVSASDLVQVDHDEYDFSYPTRLWPSVKKALERSIPKLVRNSIEEALKCYNCKAYSACAVMCGRALEALCKGHKTNGTITHKKAKLISGSDRQFGCRH
jgi:hypothetical protein